MNAQGRFGNAITKMEKIFRSNAMHPQTVLSVIHTIVLFKTVS